MTEREVILREALASDAAALVAFLNQVGRESDLITIDETGIDLSVEEMVLFAEKQEGSARGLYLVLYLDDELVGVLNITSDKHRRISHIGELFVVIAKSYWGYGLGSILLEEAVRWAREYSELSRLQLTVQERNQAAIHLYKKVGFEIEGKQERGACLDDGEFVPVYLMGLLID